MQIIEMNGSQIHRAFVGLIKQAGEKYGFNSQNWKGARGRNINILELSGSINCMIYFKIRSEEPYRWGVTANRITELGQTGKNWCLVLLYESPNNGYLISEKEVKSYLSIWPLGADGDYKVEPGSYLRHNRPFHSFTDFVDSLFHNISLKPITATG